MLNYFLLGAVFMYFLLPVMDGLLTMYTGLIEVFKSKCNLKISEHNSKISEITEKLNKPSITRKIGFQIEDPIEEDDEVYED